MAPPAAARRVCSTGRRRWLRGSSRPVDQRSTVGSLDRYGKVTLGRLHDRITTRAGAQFKKLDGLKRGAELRDHNSRTCHDRDNDLGPVDAEQVVIKSAIRRYLEAQISPGPRR